MTAHVTTLREVGKILSGLTGYDEVEYHGHTFRRASMPLTRQPDGSYDVSQAAAIRYVKCVLALVKERKGQ